MRKLLWLLFFPLMTQTAGEGAWQASDMGTILDHRGQSASSDPLTPNQPVSGLITLVTWRCELSDPISAGLWARLCSQSRYVELDEQGETTSGFSNAPTIEPMHFVREIPSGGRLIPASRIQSDRVIANYR